MPTAGLRFPNLSTAGQRARNVSGISLDFVLDTAANTNTINAQVAKELNLEIVGSVLPGVGSAGTILGGDTYMLGDCQLEGIGDGAGNSTDIFMENLTASALPIASPASAGLISLPFFYCFEGGVGFDWGTSSSSSSWSPGQQQQQQQEGPVMKDGMVTNIPSITFYGSEDDEFFKKEIETLTPVKINPIPLTNLPSVTVEINGIQIPALLDTGSPITVLNSEAAKMTGIETITLGGGGGGGGRGKQQEKKDDKNKNPFAAAFDRFKEAQSAAQAAARGEVLTIAGTDGNPVSLLKSIDAVDFSIVVDDDDNDDKNNDDKNNDDDTNTISFGKGNVYVGNLPGLAALNGIGVDSPPAIVLGMDVLRRRPKMLLRARDNLVYF